MMNQLGIMRDGKWVYTLDNEKDILTRVKEYKQSIKKQILLLAAKEIMLTF